MSQAYIAISQNQAVGVQGKARVYGYIAILRTVTTLNFKSAERHEFGFALFKKISTRMPICPTTRIHMIGFLIAPTGT